MFSSVVHISGSGLSLSDELDLKLPLFGCFLMLVLTGPAMARVGGGSLAQNVYELSALFFVSSQ